MGSVDTNWWNGIWKLTNNRNEYQFIGLGEAWYQNFPYNLSQQASELYCFRLPPKFTKGTVNLGEIPSLLVPDWLGSDEWSVLSLKNINSPGFNSINVASFGSKVLISAVFSNIFNPSVWICGYNFLWLPDKICMHPFDLSARSIAIRSDSITFGEG